MDCDSVIRDMRAICSIAATESEVRDGTGWSRCSGELLPGSYFLIIFSYLPTNLKL